MLFLPGDRGAVPQLLVPCKRGVTISAATQRRASTPCHSPRTPAHPASPANNHKSASPGRRSCDECIKLQTLRYGIGGLWCMSGVGM